MSPSSRERDYARRRHQEWQQRQGARAVRARQRRRNVTAVLAVAGTVAAVVLAVYVGFLRNGASSDPAAAPSPAAPSPAAPAATAPSSAASPSDPCPSPTSTPPAKPQQLAGAPASALAQGRSWTGTITTSCGAIGIQLDGARASAAVASFVTLARQGFFSSTRCHRLVTSGIFVLQCGDPTGTGTGGPGYTFGPIENAPANDVYPAGTLAMARAGGSASSMGSQFFLVYADSTIPHDTAGGYTVFGRVTHGLDVLTRVASAGVQGGSSGDGAPTTPISIEQVTVQ